MATWPSTLPKPLLAGSSGQVGEMVQRSEFSAGPARQRQIHTSAPESQQASWHFKQSQMIVFKSFWQNDIGGGAAWFTVDLDIGAGLASHEARFTRPYAYALLKKGFYQVSGELEVRLV